MRIRANEPMVRTNIYLSRPQHAAFRKLARQTGRTASELVRLALDRFLKAAKTAA
jgi:hypothetical protein